MPNHVHALISFINAKQSINTIIGNGKRFMAYEIIKRLEENDEAKLLQQLSADVKPIKANKKLHAIWNRPLIRKTTGAIHLFGKN